MRHQELWIVSLSLALAAGMTAASCTPAPTPGPDPSEPTAAVDPEEATRLRRALVAWFECEECTEGQLEAVVAFGETAVPSLVATLQEGPAPAQLEELRIALAESWEEMERGGEMAEMEVPEGYELSGGRERYVETYVDNYVALHRVRAARALAAIGGERAEQALRRAAEEGRYREDVQRAVKEAVAEMR